MRSTLLALVAMILLFGCGKRGALYLPDSPSQAQGTQAASQTAQRP
ncbi:MAG: LPS translocon maturation chaperone LptM [Thiobacillaceae bacterium]